MEKERGVNRMTDKIDEYIFYITMGLVAVFIVCVLLMVLGFIFNILSLISMRGVLCVI